MLWVEGEISSCKAPPAQSDHSPPGVSLTNQFFASENLEGKKNYKQQFYINDDNFTYVNGDKVNLGVTVLASLGGGHIDDLARAAYAGW